MKTNFVSKISIRPAALLLLLTVNSRFSSVLAQASWNLGGNFVSPGLFLGSTNFESVDFRAANVRVLRLEPDPRGSLAGNIIGGFFSNRVEQPGSGGNFIGGGGFVGGPNIVRSNTQGVFIGAGSRNEMGPQINDAVIGGGFGNGVRAFYGAIGGGYFGSITTNGFAAVIAGGYQNTNDGPYATVGGGSQNVVSNTAATVAGGSANFAGLYATVGGGYLNSASGLGATIPGGGGNTASGQYGFAAGYLANSLHDGSFVWSDFSSGFLFQSTTTNEFAVRAFGGARFVTSGAGIMLDGVRMTASGGGLSLNGKPILTAQPKADDSTHSGIVNVINGSSANSANGSVFGATIAGGGAANYNGSFVPNSVTADFGTVSGGKKNIASGLNATVAGGSDNTSSGFGATVGGGLNNTSSGAAATVPGGNFNSAAGSSSFAAGQNASAAHNGSFVWADSSGGTFASTAANQFLIRATGGVGIGTTTPTKLLHLRGTAPALALEDNAIAANQAGYVSFRNNSSVETAWVGFGTSGSPTFSVVNARSSGNIELRPFSGNVGVKRTPTANALEVEGNASKTVAGSWLANSDARIKTGVRTVTSALEKLSQVRLVEFRYTDEYRAQHPGIEDRRYLNVVAQEFQKVFPDEVQSSGEKLPDGGSILQVDTYPLTIYSAAAVQELNQKLEQKLKQKEIEMAELKTRLERLEQLVYKSNGSTK